MDIELSTRVDFEPVSPSMSLDSCPLFIGSCFAERIGGRLAEVSFPDTVVNPLGIAYDPISLAHQLRDLSHDRPLSIDLFENEGLWRSWSYHSRFAHPDKEEAEENIKAAVDHGRRAVASATHLFLTLGTSWVHRLSENGEVVSNRHKMPSDRFMPKLLMDPSRIVEVLAAAIGGLPKVENRKVILSVSPVRHLREGAVDNGASKGALLHACHTLSSSMADVHYLPAYDLMMDELRDYRYYTEDLVHPSPLATDIIWQRFIASYMDQDSLAFIDSMTELKRRKAHRLLHPESEASRSFLARTTEMEARLNDLYPFLSSQ